MNILRKSLIESVQTALGRCRVVVLVGPRQCGKTTLARELLSEDSVNYFDLEDPASLARLEEPMTALRPLEGKWSENFLKLILLQGFHNGT